jgi:hypothetical protein
MTIGKASNCCLVESDVENGGAGCRVVGDIIREIASKYGSVDQLPSEIFLVAKPKFHTRGLLTLRYLGNPELRSAFYSGYLPMIIPAKDGESASSFESRAVATLATRLAGYDSLLVSDLCIKKVQSKPDGLFLNRHTGLLALVEAKKQAFDFADGTSQLIQYFAQARNHAEFGELTVRSYHIAAEQEQTEGYRIWTELMHSAKDICFFVQEQ